MGLCHKCDLDNYDDLSWAAMAQRHSFARYVQRISGIDSIVANPNPKKQTPSGYSQLNLMQKIRFRSGGPWDFTYGLTIRRPRIMRVTTGSCVLAIHSFIQLNGTMVHRFGVTGLHRGEQRKEISCGMR